MPCRPGISSMSLGRCSANHKLSTKLTQAAHHGLEGIEIFYEDLADLARPPSPANLLSAGQYIRSLCASLSLEIICLQPFMHYEGLIDRQKHKERVEEMRLWIEIAQTLGTDLIQIPSTFLSEEECSGNISLIVSDLQEVADLGLQHTPPMRFAYESLAWGTHVNKWEQCWDIVLLVDRPNLGICLDSFNILANIYADPTSPSGKNVDADQAVEDSVRRLVQRLAPHKDKIFFFQLVDGERLHEPLIPGHPFHHPDQPARMSWSRNCRLFYGEEARGGYLPVKKVAEAIIKGVGFEGWVSMELFNRRMECGEDEVPEEMARRAGESWGRLVGDLGMEVGSKPAVQEKTVGESRRWTEREVVQAARL